MESVTQSGFKNVFLQFNDGRNLIRRQVGELWGHVEHRRFRSGDVFVALSILTFDKILLETFIVHVGYFIDKYRLPCLRSITYLFTGL